MPLAFTQEDFLVKINSVLRVCFCSASLGNYVGKCNGSITLIYTETNWWYPSSYFEWYSRSFGQTTWMVRSEWVWMVRVTKLQKEVNSNNNNNNFNVGFILFQLVLKITSFNKVFVMLVWSIIVPRIRSVCAIFKGIHGQVTFRWSRFSEIRFVYVLIWSHTHI